MAGHFANVFYASSNFLKKFAIEFFCTMYIIVLNNSNIFNDFNSVIDYSVSPTLLL